MELTSTPNTAIIIKDKDYLFFSGTSYLGVSTLPEFKKVITESINIWGTSFGSSRDANVKLAIYKKGEEFLKKFLKVENTLTVSSGTLASQLVIKSLDKLVDNFYFMPKTHPSILPDNAKEVFNSKTLNSSLLKIKNQTICILSDAIASLETNPFSFKFLDTISKTNKIYLLLDESHSLGILGYNGNGISSQLPKKENIEVIIVSSLGKSFGINGGFIAGKNAFINSIKKNTLFIGASGMNPSFLDAFLNGQEIYSKQRKKLQKNINYVYSKLSILKEVTMSKNYPVFFFRNDKVAEYLLDKNIIITSFYYPTTSQKINRIVLNANHTQKQLDLLIKNLITFSKNLSF